MPTLYHFATFSASHRHHKCLQNKGLQTRYVKKKLDKLSLQNNNLGQVMFAKQTNVYQKQFTDKLCLQSKTKVYKHIMFTKQNMKQKVYKTKLKFTNTLCLQNKHFGQDMFTKQKFRTSYVCKTNKCLQNKNLGQVMFTKQNYSLQTHYVYKTKYKAKVYKHVRFTKRNKCLQTRYV